MRLLPTSPRARRRFIALLVIAPVIVIAAGLSLWAIRGQVTYFYSPAEAAHASVEPGRVVRLGGLVETGSVAHGDGGVVRFDITDGQATTPVYYEGDLPDLFREGQGVVVQGTFQSSGAFEAQQVLAKHDETYMPREVADALKRQGRWQEGDSETAAP